jgi:hypothetical protein
MGTPAVARQALARRKAVDRMSDAHVGSSHNARFGSRQITRRELLGGAAGAAALFALGSTAPAFARTDALPPSAVPNAVSSYTADVATAWFDLALTLVRDTPGFSPPVASRAFGYAGVALYESLLPGMSDHRSMAGLLNDLPPLPAKGTNAAYHWPTVANAALAQILRLLFPTAPANRRADIDNQEASLVGSGAPGVINASTDRGRAVAAAVFDWSRADGGHEGYLRNFPTTYVPPEGPGLWVPTPPAFARALQPTWGGNRCFALPSGNECHPPAPPQFSEHPGSAFYTEANEVYTTVNALTAEQLAIARFWSDDPGLTPTPPGHSISILTQVLRQLHSSLGTAAEAYALLGVAVADAFIACWNAKYEYNLLRPITYIRSVIDSSWGNPLPLATPPFPEYTSGHSVQSGAMATVLGALLGEVPFTDHTHDVRGLAPRSFTSFDAAAEEAAVSRLYGGIHYRSAIEQGLDQGRCIGGHILELPLRV